jgi:hypothetical protein
MKLCIYVTLKNDIFIHELCNHSWPQILKVTYVNAFVYVKCKRKNQTQHVGCLLRDHEVKKKLLEIWTIFLRIWTKEAREVCKIFWWIFHNFVLCLTLNPINALINV